MPYRPCCVKCGKEYKVEQNGVGVLEHKEDGIIYHISASDLLKCPGCGNEITWGYGQAIHFSVEPDKVKHEIEFYEGNTRLIKVY